MYELIEQTAEYPFFLIYSLQSLSTMFHRKEAIKFILKLI
jgi:hypothetical protein